MLVWGEALPKTYLPHVDETMTLLKLQPWYVVVSLDSLFLNFNLQYKGPKVSGGIPP
jgi:hypothetical protein